MKKILTHIQNASVSATCPTCSLVPNMAVSAKAFFFFFCLPNRVATDGTALAAGLMGIMPTRE